MSEHRVTRRVALGAAAGVGLATVAGRTAEPAGAATPAVPADPPVLTTTVAVPTGGARARRAVGDMLGHRVALFRGGEAAGELVVTGTVLAVRGRPDDTAAVHHHLWRLPGGTVAGHGLVDLAGRGEFVVVGGTGDHRGATGAYLLTPGPGAGSTLTWES